MGQFPFILKFSDLPGPRQMDINDFRFTVSQLYISFFSKCTNASNYFNGIIQTLRMNITVCPLSIDPNVLKLAAIQINAPMNCEGS